MSKADTAIFTAFDDHVGCDASEPEKNLMRAILRTAMEDLKKTGQARNDAYNFFTSREDNYVFSFRSICNHLNLCHRTILELCGLLPRSHDRNPQPVPEQFQPKTLLGPEADPTTQVSDPVTSLDLEPAVFLTDGEN